MAEQMSTQHTAGRCESPLEAPTRLVPHVALSHRFVTPTTPLWAGSDRDTVGIRADRDGKPTSVDVYGPGDYASAADDCKYSLTWNDEVKP